MSLRFSYFPPVEYATNEGLLMIGGKLNSSWILKGYEMGIFPWFSPSEPLMWWSPWSRMVFDVGGVHIGKSFRRRLRNIPWEVTFDRDFNAIIEQCASIERKEKGSWIDERIKQAYKQLHALGYAHSVEVYCNKELAGGLYGVVVGGVFFGESMFSLQKDGSKVALVALDELLKRHGFAMIDAQNYTPHLAAMGGYEIDKSDFTQRLKKALSLKPNAIQWQDIIWRYNDA